MGLGPQKRKNHPKLYIEIKETIIDRVIESRSLLETLEEFYDGEMTKESLYNAVEGLFLGVAETYEKEKEEERRWSPNE
jgi:hypothetical protein